MNYELPQNFKNTFSSLLLCDKTKTSMPFYKFYSQSDCFIALGSDHSFNMEDLCF